MRQLLVESLLLALAGSVAGCLFAWGGIRALLLAMPRQNVPYETEIALDGPVLAFALAAAALSAFLFGLLPALHAARRDILPGLRSSGKGVGGSARHGRVRNGLVVAQVALSLVLLLGAGLLMRTFVALIARGRRLRPGAHRRRTPIAFAPGQYEGGEARHRFLRDAAARVGALPGVEVAAVSNGLPPFGGLQSEVEIDGRARRRGPGDHPPVRRATSCP